MNKFIIVLCGLLLMSACTEKPIKVEKEKGGTLLEEYAEYQVISSQGFSLRLPEKWRISFERGDIAGQGDGILGQKKTEGIGMIIGCYVPTTRHDGTCPSQWSRDTFANELQHSIWHSEKKQEQRPENLMVESQDIQQKDICTFVRRYTTQRVVFQLILMLEGRCKTARPEFEAIEKSFIWKK